MDKGLMHYFVRVACVGTDPQPSALLAWRGLAGANRAWRAVFVSEWLEYLRTHAYGWLAEHHRYACSPPSWYLLDEIMEGRPGTELLRHTLAPTDLFHFALLYQQYDACSNGIEHMDNVTLKPYHDAMRPILNRVYQREMQLKHARYGQGRDKRSTYSDANNKAWTEQMLERNQRALTKLKEDPDWMRLSATRNRYGNDWVTLRESVQNHVASAAWARFLAVAKADVRARRAAWRHEMIREEADEARQALQAAQLLWEDAQAQLARAEAHSTERQRKRTALMADLAPGLDAGHWTVSKRPLTDHEMEEFSSSVGE